MQADESTVLLFGKYKGLSVESVMEKDAQYLMWVESKGLLSFSDDLQEAISINAEIEHAEFLREYCDNEQCIEY